MCEQAVEAHTKAGKVRFPIHQLTVIVKNEDCTSHAKQAIITRISI